jgi:pyrroline-5-carboxylate reductase
MKTIGIIGTGVMGCAIAAGVRSVHPDTTMYLFDLSADSSGALSARVGGTVTADPAELVRKVKAENGTVIIAVKPQHLSGLAGSLEASAEAGRFISIAAGCSIESLGALFPGSSIIRFMPNVAARIGKSVVAVAALAGTDPDFMAEAVAIAESIGKAVILDESLISAFIGLSGSGIAYVFSFIHALALGGTENGIPYPKSLSIALETVRGAVELLSSEEVNPAEMITRVTSAGGTTIKGIAALEKGAFTHTVMDAVRCTTEKAKNMEKGTI